MEKDAFQNEFGTVPTLKKRVKRDRSNDLFEIVEQDLLIQDDPLSDIYSFSSYDGYSDTPPIPVEPIPSLQSDFFSESPDYSYVDDDISKKIDMMELSIERSPNYHEETTQSIDSSEKEVQYSQYLLNIRERLNNIIVWSLKYIKDIKIYDF